MTLPNFLVIGAQRAGTSLLHQIFLKNFEIYVPTRRKEVHFFDRYFDRGTAWYQRYFPTGESAQLYSSIGEITPDYLCTPEVPARIATTLLQCKLLVILRNPVCRAYSWYQYCCRTRNDQRTFSSFLRNDPTCLDWGVYH